MSNHIKWHQSLIKKFNSTTHSKLLNQLKLEVKAYPLKRNNSEDEKKVRQEIQVRNIENNNRIKEFNKNSLTVNSETSNENQYVSQTIYKSAHFNNTNRSSDNSNFKTSTSIIDNNKSKNKESKPTESLNYSNRESETNINEITTEDTKLVDTSRPFKDRLKDIDLR